ncbi:MAG: hypothetical protein HC874_14195 [Richelia sp. SL_2_1]|nr:hypothetical protein [Richelia sp. SL_2_1]
MTGILTFLKFVGKVRKYWKMKIHNYNHKGNLINAHAAAKHAMKYNKGVFANYRAALSHYLKVYYRAARIIQEQNSDKGLEAFYNNNHVRLMRARLTD